MKAKPISSKVIMTVAVIVFLLALVTTVFLHLINNKKARVVELHQILNDEINLNASLDASKQVIKDTEIERGVINSYFVEKKNIVGFLEFLENIGRDIGVSVHISTIETEKVVNEGDKPNLGLIINVKGDWTGVLRYIKLLEAIPYKVKVGEVKISLIGGDDSGKTKPQWEGSLNIKALMSL